MHSATSFTSSDRNDGHGHHGLHRPSFQRQSSSSTYSISALAAAIGNSGNSGNLSPTLTRRLQPKSHGMLTGDTKECKYEQDLEFSATSRQLKYRKSKEEKSRKLKRLKRLQKIREHKLKQIHSKKRLCPSCFGESQRRASTLSGNLSDADSDISDNIGQATDDFIEEEIEDLESVVFEIGEIEQEMQQLQLQLEAGQTIPTIPEEPELEKEPIKRKMEPVNVKLEEQVIKFSPNVNKMMTPMRMIIAGPSQSGKTKFLVALVKYREAIFNTKFSRILYCVPSSANESHQAVFDELKGYYPQAEYFLDLPKLNEITNDNLPKLVLLDDLMEKLFNSKDWESIFTTFSHHNSCSVAFTSQNYFLGKSKTIIRQCNYTVIFDSPTNKSYIRNISCQLEPDSPNFLNNIFQELDSMFPSNNYKYILVDGNAQSPMKRLKIRTNIFPNSDGAIEPLCFFPCKS